jgi:hypothetical protein
MADKSLEVMVGRPEPSAPPMVELTLVEENGDAHRFWFLPNSARDFAVEVAGCADQADALRLAGRSSDE